MVISARPSSAILFMTLLHGLLVYAVVPGWISFISAFPARRFFSVKSKLNVSGVENSDVCLSV